VGVELTDSLRPDVVVMDIEMPVMDGIEASKEINERHHDLPIVILSGSNVEDRLARSRASGAAAFVEKGRAASSLVETILAVASRAAQARTSG
jgi:CheY-like chemotaxis protein